MTIPCGIATAIKFTLTENDLAGDQGEEGECKDEPPLIVNRGIAWFCRAKTWARTCVSSLAGLFGIRL